MRRFWQGSVMMLSGTLLLLLMFRVNAIDPNISPTQSTTDLQCDFMKKTCKWDNVDKWAWKKPEYDGGVQLDGPTGIDNAYSLVANLTLSSKYKYNFTSPAFNSAGAHCFTFDYYIMVDQVFGGLSLSLVDGFNKMEEIWFSGTLNADRWARAQVQIIRSGSVRLEFVAMGQIGFIAVRKFQLNSGVCDSTVCDFESGTCGWTSSGTPSGYSFHLAKINDIPFKVKQDHTSRSPFGHVLHVTHGGDGSKAQVNSPVLSNLNTQCFTFWFMQRGSGFELKVYTYSQATFKYEQIWQSDRDKNLGDEWIRVQNTVTIQDRMSLVIEATKTGISDSNLVLDDLSINPFACDAPVACSKFDNGNFCGWKEEVRRSNLRWALGPGRVTDATKVNFTRLPSVINNVLYSDFTTIKGPSTMEMLSEVVESPKSGGACFGMRYNVYSLANDTDSFEVAQIGVNGNRTLLWKFTDSTLLTHWADMKVMVANPNQNVPYRFSILAKSSHPSTYFSIYSITYSTKPWTCSKSFTSPAPTTTTAAPTLGPQNSLDCDFEQNTLCNWHQQTGIRFRVTTGQASHGLYNPFFDHTKHSQTGHFALISSAFFKIPTNGALLANNPLPNQNICVRFGYWFYAAGPSTFSMTMDNATGSVTVFQAYGANEIIWRDAYFTIEQNVSYTQLAFRANVEMGSVAIDDISIKAGACPSKSTRVACDFESGNTCVFEPIYAGTNLKWLIARGDNIRYDFADHTTRTSSGHMYGFFLTQVHQQNATNFQIRSKSMSAYDIKCFRFSYFLNNVKPNTTLYYEIVSDTNLWRVENVRPWQTSGSTSGLWFTHQYSIERLKNYRKFHVVMGIDTGGDNNPGAGLIFVDDIIFDSSPCVDLPMCDFESGDTCGMDTIVRAHTLQPFKKEFLAKTKNYTKIVSTYLTDYVDQTWHVFTPRQSPNFVQKDHSLGNDFGKYLLLTAQNKFDRGIMVTRRYEAEPARKGVFCFSFALYKPSASDSVLEVYQGESSDAGNGLKLWDTRQATQGWQVIDIQAKLQDLNSKDIFFYFVGTLVETSTYIALDDVQMIPLNSGRFCQPANSNPLINPSTTPPPTPNPGSIFTCRSGKQISIDKTCNWVNDCEQGDDETYCGSCDFADHSFCRYDIDSTSDDRFFTAFRFNFSDTINVITPGVPKTSSHGNAVFLEAYGAHGETKLISPVIHQSYNPCEFSFYYNYDSNNGSISSMSLYLQLLDLNSRVQIWQSNAQRMTKQFWNKVAFPLERIAHPFRLVFHAFAHNEVKRVYHAIDHISMVSCAPPKAFKNQDCSRLFRCANQVCIGLHLVCDLQDDCGDGSDEVNCDKSLVTSFEFGINRWGEGLSTGWALTRASLMGDLRNGPTYDHTTGYMHGKYLFAGANHIANKIDSKPKTIIAQIDSAPFSITSTSGCDVRFYMMMNSGNGSLALELLNLINGKRQVLNVYRFPTVRFVRFWDTLVPDSPNSIYKVIFTATMNISTSDYVHPYIALDDISFTKECSIKTSVPTLPTLPNHSPMTTAKPDSCPIRSCLSAANATQICLRVNQLCDFVRDCNDGSDEVNCGDCNFDDGLTCGWTNAGEDPRQVWKVIKPASTAPTHLPKLDASGNANGGYEAIYSTFAGILPTYLNFQSPRINGPTAASCKIQFSYRTLSKATLIVMQPDTRASQEATLFSSTKIVPQWTSFEVAIGRQKAGINIQLWTSTSFKDSLSPYKDVTFDNIKLVECNPYTSTPKPSANTSLSCDFEQNLCGWNIVGVNERSKWQRTGDANREPGNDHTSLKLPTPARSGIWLTSQAIHDVQQEMDYLVTRIPIKAGQASCISFWYYFMQLDYFSFFGLFVSNSPEALPNPSLNPNCTAMWRTSNTEARNWNQQFVEIPEQKNDFYLLFYAQVSATTVVGLDDIDFSNGTCPVISNELCDFEVNNCDWNVTGEWPRRTDQVQYVDHTTRTSHGHYLQVGTTGKPVSMVKELSTLPYYLNPSNNALDRKQFCLRLYYLFDSPGSNKAKGDHESRLTMRVKTPGTRFVSSLSVNIDETIEENQLHTWQMATFDFKANKKEAIEVDAFAKEKYTIILVDDVLITEGACQTEGNCDFERDMCGWTNVRMHMSPFNLMWLRIRPSSQYIKGKLLRFDHTTNSPAGNYLVMPSQMEERSMTTLRSPVIHRDTSDKICLTLYYFVQETNAQSVIPADGFKISFIDLTNNKGARYDYVSATGRLEWTKFTRQYDQLPKAFALEIETKFTQGIQSDIGLDDITITPGSCSNSNVQTSTTTTPEPINEKILDCNFDDGRCNWEFDKDNWNIANAKTAKTDMPPRHDHTYKSLLGKYLLFNSKGDLNQGKYSISSTAKFPYTQTHCLTLWYYEDGEAPFEIQFQMLPPGDLREVKVYQSAIENRQKWSLLKVDIPYEPSYNTTSMGLIINYRPTKGAANVFAIDDIAVKPGKCAHQADYVYTFDNGIEDLDLFDIQPRNQAIGRTYLPQFEHLNGVPSVDHTTYTDRGHYFLFMNGKSGQTSNEYIEALVMKDIPADSDSTCVRFAYQMYGNVTLKVLVAAQNRNMRTAASYRNFPMLWTSAYSKTRWTIAEFNSQTRYVHHLVLYMEKPVDTYSYIAIDDLTVLSHKCQLPINCDFEEGRFCSYSPFRDHTTNDYNFGIYRALTDQNQNWPGPQYDHTTRNFDGGYLYLTAYRATKSFNQIVSKIVSGTRKIDPNKNYCLTLWTRLTTSDLSVRLYLLRYGNKWTDSNRTVTLSTVAKQAQADWTALSVSLDSSIFLASTFEVQLLIEGRLGANSKGVIAIDDILLTQGLCANKNGLVCEDGTQLRQDQICNFVNDCPSGMDELNCGNCDFESGTCGWMNVTSRREWRLTTFAESANPLAPKFDGSGNKNGHYMLLKTPSIAQIINAEMCLNYATPSMYLKSAYKTCVMQFDYFVQTSKKYNIMVTTGLNLGNLATIYSISLMSTGGWRKGYAHIGERFSPFLVDIYGSLNDGLSGAMAVDNIQFVKCSMPKPLGPNQVCKRREFMCTKNRFCISTDDLCDYVNDCGDGSDEQNCSAYPNRCNFEFSLDSCGITSDRNTTSSVEWNVRAASTAFNELYEPKIDNTKRSSSGHYFVMESKRMKLTGNESNNASFYSPMMTSRLGQFCQVRYFYFINGEPFNIESTNLQVFIRYADKLVPESIPITTARVQIQTAMEQRWNKAYTLFSSPNRSFQFVFRGNLGTKVARIAVDDITFSSDCVPSMVRPLTTTLSPPTSSAPSNILSSSTLNPTPIGNQHRKPNSAGGIVAAIVTPLLLVLGIVLGYYGYRRYQKSKQTDENFTVLSMKSLRERHD